MWHERGTRVLLVVSSTGTLVASVPVAGLVARTWVTWLLFVVLHVWFCVDSWHAWRAPSANGPTRRLWRLFFVAGVLFLLGDVVQLAALATQPWSDALATGVPLQQVLVLCGTGLALLAALVEPVRLGSRQARLRFWLDMGVVLIGVGAIGVYALPPAQAGTVQAVVQVFVLGPGLFSLFAFAVLKLVLAAERPFTRTAGRLLALAALGEASLALVTMRVDLAHDMSLIFALTLLSNSLLALSARAQRSGPAEPPRAVTGRPPLTRLPYVAIVTTNALLAYALATGGVSERTWALLCATIASTCLVLARQLLSLSESSWLLAELDRRLAELGAALTERDDLTARLADLAYHDPLTGLANRALFDESLEKAVGAGRTGRAPGRAAALAVLLVDLDGFKEVNDTHGHACGDALLVQVADRIRSCVRRDDVVARFGGDEFCLLLPGTPEDAAAAARRIVDALSRPFDVAGTTVQVGASAGLATLDPSTVNGHELVRRADAAMYTAKRLGKGQVHVDPGRRG